MGYVARHKQIQYFNYDTDANLGWSVWDSDVFIVAVNTDPARTFTHPGYDSLGVAQFIKWEGVDGEYKELLFLNAGADDCTLQIDPLNTTVDLIGGPVVPAEESRTLRLYHGRGWKSNDLSLVIY